MQKVTGQSNNSATQNSLDRVRLNVVWFADYRANLFKMLLTAYLAALGFYYGIGSSTNNQNVTHVLKLIPWAMLVGAIIVCAVDLLFLFKNRKMIRDAYYAEEESGTTINSFAYLRNTMLMELRLFACYLFGAVISTGILIHEYGFALKWPF